MRLGKDIEGKPIISVADGRILGRSKDTFIDPDLRTLTGLFVGSEGVIRRKSLVIAREDVNLFGIDVILVKNAEVITNDKVLLAAKEWKRLKDVQGREVRTPGGTKLGVIGDVVLDETGDIVGFSLSRVFVEGPLAEQGAVPREAVVNVAQEDGSIGVDLAKLEGLVTGAAEESAVETKTGPAEDEEPAETTDADPQSASAEEGLRVDVADLQNSPDTGEERGGEEEEISPAGTEPESNNN